MNEMHLFQRHPLGKAFGLVTAISSSLFFMVFIANAADEAKKSESANNEQLLERNEDSRGRFRLKGKAGFLMRGSFTGLGMYSRPLGPSGIGPGAPAGEANRYYDDGFNLTDLGPAVDTRTGDWGFYNESQADRTGGSETITMNSSTALSDAAVKNVDSDIAPGVELGYLYRVRETSRGSWGILAAFGYSFVSVSDNSLALGTEVKISDTFDGSGAVIPAAVYEGSQAGVPRIENDPKGARVTATIPGGSGVGGLREIDANVLDFRLGPALEYDLSEKVTLNLSAGGVAALIDSEFSVSESTTILGNVAPYALRDDVPPGGTALSPTQTTNTSASDSGFVFGAFAGVDLDFEISPRTSIFVGAQYQYLQDFTQTLGARRATLHLDRALNANLGLSFSF